MKFVARQGESDVDVEVFRHGLGYRVRIGDRWIEADFVKAGPYIRSLRLDDGTQFALVHHLEGTRHEVTLAGTTVHVDLIDPLAAKRRRREDEVAGGGAVIALMPGRVVRILVAPGDEVQKGAGVLILEAMKMENEIQAPRAGRVEQILVEAGQTVEGGAELVTIT